MKTSTILAASLLLCMHASACPRPHRRHHSRSRPSTPVVRRRASGNQDLAKGSDYASVYRGRSATHEQGEVAGHNWRLTIEIDKRDRNGHVLKERRVTTP